MVEKTFRKQPNGQIVDVEDIARDYRHVFGTPWGQRVAADLAQFLYANESTWVEDAREHARREGLRQAWLHINNHLAYTPDQIARLYRGLSLLTEKEVQDGVV